MYTGELEMKKSLYIVGAGRFGRELLQWALDVPESDRDWEVAGFLDNNSDALDGFDTGYRVVGDADAYTPGPNDVFVCSIGNPVSRLAVCRRLEARGFEFAIVKHPTSVVGSRCKIGPGSVLCPYTIVTVDVTIGRHCHLNLHTTIGHDTVLGDGVTMSPHADINGCVTVGEGVFLGSGSGVIPGVTLHDRCVLGAGAVAVRDIPEGVTAVGIPAKPR